MYMSKTHLNVTPHGGTRGALCVRVGRTAR